LAQSIDNEGRVRFTLTANQSQKVTLRSGAKAFSVVNDATSPATVRVGTATGAVADSTTPTHYFEVAAGFSSAIEPVLQSGAPKYIWVFSTGAAVVTVSDYLRV